MRRSELLTFPFWVLIGLLIGFMIMDVGHALIGHCPVTRVGEMMLDAEAGARCLVASANRK